MAGMPEGTVTLLFTDIEGSTLLLRKLGDRYGEALATQRALLRSAFEAAGGHEIDTQGGSFAHGDPHGRAGGGRRGLPRSRRPPRGSVCSAAHGAQILLSQSTRELA